METQLADWEQWAADLLQDELSYPMLAYFRSQHLNQSWLGALVAITDTSAMLMLCGDGDLKHQAEATFAMGTHALADSAKALGLSPVTGQNPRQSDQILDALRQIVAGTRTSLDPSSLTKEQFAKLRHAYEPYSTALSSHLLMALPPWIHEESAPENWESSSRQPRRQQYAVSDPFEKNNGRQ